MSTYTPIASITLASAASSVTFSGIPQTYTDLVVVINGTSSASGELRYRLNGNTGSNYSFTQLYGDGSSAGSSRDSNRTVGRLGSTRTTDNVQIGHFQNYSNSTTNKTVLSRESTAGSIVQAFVGLWRQTAAITSIEFLTETGNFSSGITFNLYGIANASITNVAKATGGDSVYTDGTYWYHIFRSSGTFTPTQALTADYLVVAGGGGGGGNNNAGGGGAGGLRCTVTATGGGGSLESALSLTAQAYTVTVGAGGAGQAINGSNGSNSVFSTITSTGGGGGGGAPTPGGAGSNIGAVGGSGGGSIYNTTATPAAGTANQGYAGGAGQGATSPYHAGGGGGAGEAGNTDGQGQGGDGVATSITGTSTTYAGGGGGGTNAGAVNVGGTGGGGSGATSGGTAPQAGTANTGGGGGGGSSHASTTTGGTGGSGIVVIRYSAA